MTEVERIVDQMRRAFEGGAWCGSALREVLADVTPAEAASRQGLAQVIFRNMDYNVRPIRRGDQVVFDVRAGFAKVLGTGMGVCLLKRRVFEEMVSRGVARKHLDYHPTTGARSPYYGFFDTLTSSPRVAGARCRAPAP